MRQVISLTAQDKTLELSHVQGAWGFTVLLAWCWPVQTFTQFKMSTFVKQCVQVKITCIK